MRVKALVGSRDDLFQRTHRPLGDEITGLTCSCTIMKVAAIVIVEEVVYEAGLERFR